MACYMLKIFCTRAIFIFHFLMCEFARVDIFIYHALSFTTKLIAVATKASKLSRFAHDLLGQIS